MKNRNFFQHPDLYVREAHRWEFRLKKQNTVFQHPDLHVRLSAQMGNVVNLRNKEY